MDDDRGLCRSSTNLKTVYEGTESLGEPQGLGSKPVQQALAALQRSLHISLHTASKLFLLSLIWRAGIASKIPFDNIALGEHEENIRKLLSNNDPGAPGCYPSILQMFRTYRAEMRSAIMLPFKRVHEDVTAYRTYFLGFMCTTYMSPATPESRLQGVLCDNGALPVKVMSEIQENACIGEIAMAFPSKDQEGEDV